MGGRDSGTWVVFSSLPGRTGAGTALEAEAGTPVRHAGVPGSDLTTVQKACPGKLSY